ncbi:hypothetical protein [Niastella populi]|uniref:Uncharacterized protein n=1 Tax=Niastella populi TaxID=550983 RepID=A0A1V9FGY5_9BACT|nr:hypothetical protein [Niastella populi]OQP57531.1 hypothetical protein A4R26_24480 [Niastella populi]
MFELDTTIKNVRDFLFTQQGELLIVGKENKFHFELMGQQVTDFLISNPNWFFLYKDNVYYSELDGIFYSFNIKSKTRALVTERKMSTVVNCENEFLVAAGESIHSEIIDIESGKVLLELPFLANNPFFTSRFYCTAFSAFDKLYCYNRETYELAWELNVAKYGISITGKNLSFKGEVTNIIGEWNGILLLHITHSKILGINSEGKKVWEIDNFLTPQEYVLFSWNTAYSVKSSIQWLLNAEQGKLYLLGRRFIMEFDLSTRKRTILHDCSQVPSEQGWSFLTGKLVDSYILFRAYSQSLGPNVIGLFDLSCNNMIWYYKLEDADNSFLKEPVMKDNKIYALDDKQDLRVFKPA